jgi:predicted dehydrogenase
MVRIGLIGLGFMGRTHFEAYSKIPQANVVAIADRDPNRARGDLSGVWGNLGNSVGNQLPMDKIKGTIKWPDLMASPDIDMIDICVPTPDHMTIVLAALKSGKHVMCEKPLARTSADAIVVAKAAAESKAFFMPAMCMRFWSEWEWLATAIRDGRYGKVLSANFSRQGACPAGWYRNGALSGGALLDLHVHDVDFVYHVFGKPRGVFSRGFTVHTGELDHIVTQYIYDNGPTVTTTGSWANSPGTPFTMLYHVQFEKATINFDMSRPQTLMSYYDDKAEPIELPEKISGYIGELRYFVDCVASGRKPTHVTADDAVVGLQMIEAEKKSVERGKIVEL